MPDRAAHPPHDHAVRVLRVITRLNIGGPAIQAIALSDRLRARGFRTCLMYGRLSRGEGDMGYLLPPGVDAEHIRTLRRSVSPGEDAVTVARLFRALRRFRPAIVHTHTAKAGTLGRLATALYNATFGRSVPTRIVHTYHGHVLEGYFSPGTTSMFIAAERGLAKRTDRLVAISPRIRDELVERYRIGDLSQYRVVPLGFDLDRFAAIDAVARCAAREALGIPATAHVASIVGRLTAIKDHRLFLAMAQIVATRDPLAMFLVVGDGELRLDLERLAESLNLAHCVRFLGWRRDLTTIYAASDATVLTSTNEGTPVALIESLAAGVPIVSTDVGGVRDVIVHEGIGRLAASGDAQTLATHVLHLIGDPEKARAMGRQGRAHVLVRFGMNRLVDDIEMLYRELLG